MKRREGKETPTSPRSNENVTLLQEEEWLCADALQPLIYSDTSTCTEQAISDVGRKTTGEARRERTGMRNRTLHLITGLVLLLWCAAHIAGTACVCVCMFVSKKTKRYSRKTKYMSTFIPAKAATDQQAWTVLKYPNCSRGYAGHVSSLIICTFAHSQRNEQPLIFMVVSF